MIETLLSHIRGATDAARRAAQTFYADPENSRAYGCAGAGCTRAAVSKGLCNAHYLRSRTGRPMDEPLTIRKRDDACAECGKETGGKGGWGLCPTHYKKRRSDTIKDAAVAAMGGSCAKCGGVFHRSVFDFHHVGDKAESPSYLLANASPEEIADELSKCVLLCANCHRMEHHDDRL